MKYVLIALIALGIVQGAAAHTPAAIVKNYSDTAKPAKKPTVIATDSTAMDSTALVTDTTYKSSNYPSDRVQVKGYYRKDGKYVAPYTRSAPKKRH